MQLATERSKKAIEIDGHKKL